MLMLTLGTGVGGGIISGGRPYRGASGAAAEIGHIIIDVNGPKCPANCPNHGCLEAYVAGPAMGAAARVAAELEPDSALGRALAAGEHRRQPAAHAAWRWRATPAPIAVLERAGEYLGAGLVTLVQHLRPRADRDRRRRGGGGRAAASPRPAASSPPAALPPARDRVRVVPAALGPDAGFIGAAALALTSCSRRRACVMRPRAARCRGLSRAGRGLS